MKITIFGANGKTGRLLVEQALNQGHTVTAYVRRKDALSLTHSNLKITVGALNDSVQLREAIKGSDACISALGGGSLSKHASEFIAGIHAIVGMMEKEQVGRFIYLSSIGSGDSRSMMAQPMRFFIADLLLRIPLADHHTNEQRITKSNLQWTVIRPGGLTDGAKTNNLQHGTEPVLLKSSPSISRANVAAFMLEQLTSKDYLNQAVWLYE